MNFFVSLTYNKEVFNLEKKNRGCRGQVSRTICREMQILQASILVCCTLEAAEDRVSSTICRVTLNILIYSKLEAVEAAMVKKIGDQKTTFNAGH